MLTQEIQDTAGVSPLVVVPRDELDELVVERDTGLGIEDRGVVVSVQVGRDDVILRVGEYASLRSVRLGRLDPGRCSPLSSPSEAFLMAALISS